MKINGKEVKILKEYSNFILVEHRAGYKEYISKHDLGLIKERLKVKSNLAKMPKI